MIRNWVVLVSTVAIALTIATPSVQAQEPEKKPVIEQSPLLKEPTTPEETFGATLLMVGLGRMDLAQKYLEQFTSSEPDDDLLLRLRDKYGTGDFLKLAQIKDLQPRSTELLDRLTAAARKQVNDPAFVDALVDRLTRGPTERDLAILELRNAGPRVVPEIIRQMSRPEMADHQDTMVVALTRMGRQVIPPLIGALDCPVERVRAAVIDALGWLDATEAVPFLWFPAFDETQPDGVSRAAKRVLAKLTKGSPLRAKELSSVDAANELRRAARGLYFKQNLLAADDDGNVPLWLWDEAGDQLTLQPFPPPIAALMVSTRFARQALALSPEQPEPQRQYLASLLGLEVAREGWDQPRLAAPGTAMYLALTAGESMVSQVLAEALEAGQSTTAVAALEVLGQIGSREQLVPQRGLKSPVLAALNSPDLRVQFAAASTILKLEPKSPFAGAPRLVAILTRALVDPGQSAAVVIDSDGERARTMADFLTDGGYRGLAATSGREGFELAANTNGVDLIAIHVNCQRWEISQTIANLRADARTAAIPIVIYGPPELHGRMNRLVAHSAPAVYASESATGNDLMVQIEPYLRGLKSEPMSPQERELQKKAAAYWLATIGTGQMSRLFDLSKSETELVAAVEDPVIAVNAIVAIGSIPSETVQKRLSDIALNPQGDPSLREVAASQMAYHIQRHGLLLDREEVLHLHDVWKQTDNPAVKSALAVVIGSLRPNATVVGERLRQYAVPKY